MSQEREVAVGDCTARVRCYVSRFDALQHVAVVFGDVIGGEGVPCRIFRENPMADLIARGTRQDLDVAAAFDAIAREGGRGVVIMLRNSDALDPELAGDSSDSDSNPGPRDGEHHASAMQREARWRRSE